MITCLHHRKQGVLAKLFLHLYIWALICHLAQFPTLLRAQQDLAVLRRPQLQQMLIALIQEQPVQIFILPQVQLLRQ